MQRCTGAMRCQQLSQNLGSFFGVFFLFFPLFFWNSLKEMGKEGTGRADAVRRSFWRLWRSTESSPKGTCTFPGGFLLLHSKDSEGIPIWRVLQAGDKEKKKRKQTWNESSEHNADPNRQLWVSPLSYQEQEKDKGWERSGTNPWLYLFFYVFNPNL